MREHENATEEEIASKRPSVLVLWREDATSKTARPTSVQTSGRTVKEPDVHATMELRMDAPLKCLVD